MIVLSANNLTKAYGTDLILQGISFHVNEGDRVGIIGVNGAGKTTLLRMLTGELSRDEGEVYISGSTTIGYLKQAESFSGARTVLDAAVGIFQGLQAMEEELEKLSQEIAAGSREGKEVDRLLDQHHRLQEQYEREGGYTYRSEITGILNSMAFTEDMVHKKLSTLSGGERTRLSLACLLLKKPELLFLDEPTNHLDIDSREALVAALNAYDGAVVLVSHDPHLIELVADRLLLVADGKVASFDGDLAAYRKLLLERAREARRGGEAKADGPSRKDERRAAAEVRSQLAPLRKKAFEAEKVLEKLHTRKAAVQEKLADPKLYQGPADKVTKLQRALGEVEKEVAEAEVAWLMAHEELEEAQAAAAG